MRPANQASGFHNTEYGDLTTERPDAPKLGPSRWGRLVIQLVGSFVCRGIL